MGRLEGRTAIVTGASRGIGRAIALAMAAEGAAVAVVARTEQVWDDRLPGTIGETVAAITAAGGRAVAIRADLTDEADRQRVVAEARAALGPITILVNNAAFTAPGGPQASARARPAGGAAQPAATGRVAWPTFANTPLRAYRKHFEMVFAAYQLMQAVMPDMEAAGRGSIINITSGASRMPGEGPWRSRKLGALAGYGGSKAALEHLTTTAAYEAGDLPIAINAMSPTVTIRTPGVAYYSQDWIEYDTDANFAEAAVRLALVDPAEITGRILGHTDVLDGSFNSYVLRDIST